MSPERCTLSPSPGTPPRKTAHDAAPFSAHPGSEHGGGCWVAGGLGFEPRQLESESRVLPLDDPPTKGAFIDRGPARIKGLEGP